MPRVIAIAAMDYRRIIGDRGKLPWDLPQDLKRFKELTTGHIVVVGRKTYEGLPRLLGREVAVLANKVHHPNIKAGVFHRFESVLHHYKNDERTIWIAGGAEVYRSTMPYWHELYLTLVEGVHYGDTYMPPFEERAVLMSKEIGVGCEYYHYRMAQNGR